MRRAGARRRCRAPEDSEISLRVIPPASGHAARTAKGRVGTKGRTAKATSQRLLRDAVCEAACASPLSLSSLPPIVLHLQRRDCFSPMQMKFMAAGAARTVNILSSVKLFYITWILFLLIFLSPLHQHSVHRSLSKSCSHCSESICHSAAVRVRMHLRIDWCSEEEKCKCSKNNTSN